jgi:hypothetical protein
MIADEAPPNRAVSYSPDGMHFKSAAEIDVHLSDPGVLRRDCNPGFGIGVEWGLSQLYDERKVFTNQLGQRQSSSYIVRWDCDMRVAAP